jgi:hypothetical protein
VNFAISPMNKDRAKLQVAAVVGAVLGIVTGYVLGKPLLAYNYLGAHWRGRSWHGCLLLSGVSLADTVRATLERILT